jgi:heptosyltransferase I
MQERNNKLMKKMDRYIGCPLLYGLGLFRKKRAFSELENSPRIVLLKTAAIGDTILMDAMIKEIKRKYPSSTITLICSKSNVAMAEILENIDKIVLFQMGAPFKSLRAIAALGHFDLLLDFGPWPRINGIIAWQVSAAFKIGFKTKRMYRHYVYDVAVEHRDDIHEIENYRNILRAVHIDIHGFIPELKIDAQHQLINEPYVIFHIFPGGSSISLRSWKNENWLEIGKRIYEKYGYKVIFSGGPEDREDSEKMVKILQAEHIDAESIAAKYPLKYMPSILAKAQLVISVNTGIMHMSAAVQVPLIALHGATSVIRWGPLSNKAIIIKSDEKCQPCISLGFESKCKDPVCMQHITVDMVWKQVMRCLAL